MDLSFWKETMTVLVIFVILALSAWASFSSFRYNNYGRFILWTFILGFSSLYFAADEAFKFIILIFSSGFLTGFGILFYTCVIKAQEGKLIIKE